MTSQFPHVAHVYAFLHKNTTLLYEYLCICDGKDQSLCLLPVHLGALFPHAPNPRSTVLCIELRPPNGSLDELATMTVKGPEMTFAELYYKFPHCRSAWLWVCEATLGMVYIDIYVYDIVSMRVNVRNIWKCGEISRNIILCVARNWRRLWPPICSDVGEPSLFGLGS